VSLRKSPTRTAALLAANRANAQKSTGPRTPEGKARVGLNSLKHGGYAVQLEERLGRAGYGQAQATYRKLRQEICEAFGTTDPQHWRQADRLASRVWLLARQGGVFGDKPEYPLKSVGKGDLAPSIVRIRIVEHRLRLGLVYWIQRRRYLSSEEVREALRTGLPPAAPLERCLRKRTFRLGRPKAVERIQYGLNQNGNYDPAEEARIRRLQRQWKAKTAARR
jgi:hypothetical protein